MIGLDVARGLAVLGLLCGALGAWVPGSGLGGPGSGVLGAEAGSSGSGASAAGALPGFVALVVTALFVLVSGVSVSRMLAASGTSPMPTQEPQGDEAGRSAACRNRAPVRLAVRSAVLFAIGAVGAEVGGEAAFGGAQPSIMLQLLGALGLAGLLLRRWRARTLFIAAGLSVLLLPAANVLLLAWARGELPGLIPDPPTASGAADPTVIAAEGAARNVVHLVATGAFPVLVWIAPFLAGLAVGRLPQHRAWRPFTLLAVGGGLFAASVGGSLVVASAFADTGIGRAVSGSVSSSTAGAGVLDVLGSSAVALSVLALCLLVAEHLRWLLLPLATLGSLALTVSSTLFVAALLLPPGVARGLAGLAERSNSSLAGAGFTPPVTTLLPVMAALVGICLLTTLWRAVLGRGPVERLGSALADSAARAPEPTDADSFAAEPRRRASFAPAAVSPPEPGGEDEGPTSASAADGAPAAGMPSGTPTTASAVPPRSRLGRTLAPGSAGRAGPEHAPGRTGAAGSSGALGTAHASGATGTAGAASASPGAGPINARLTGAAGGPDAPVFGGRSPRNRGPMTEPTTPHHDQPVPEPRARFSLRQAPPPPSPAQSQQRPTSAPAGSANPRKPRAKTPEFGSAPAAATPPTADDLATAGTASAGTGAATAAAAGTVSARANDATAPPTLRWNPGQSLGRLPY